MRAAPFRRWLWRLAGVAWIGIVLYAYRLQQGMSPHGPLDRWWLSFLESLAAQFLQ